MVGEPTFSNKVAKTYNKVENTKAKSTWKTQNLNKANLRSIKCNNKGQLKRVTRTNTSSKVSFIFLLVIFIWFKKVLWYIFIIIPMV